MTRFVVASALLIGVVAVIALAGCGGGTKAANDAQAWSMQPNIVENSLTFDDGSTVRVHVIDASGRRCYAIASVDGVGFTTSAPKAGKLNVSNVDLTVTVAGQEDCSLAGD